MRTKTRWMHALLCLALTLALPFGAAQARPSLDPKDTIDEIAVEIDGVQESFTVIRDASRRNQWYYAPSQPRLYETAIAGERRPEFVLVRYQAPDPKDPEAFIEAGLMQFSVRLSLPPKPLEQLEQALASKVGGRADKVHLAALPMKKAKVSVYKDDGTLIGGQGHFESSGLAPTFATQKMAFHVPLTQLGADVYDALVNGTTGVLVSVQFAYDGLTPPANVQCRIDWDETYQLYTRDQKFAVKATYLGAFNAEAKGQLTKVRDRLEQEKAVVCEGISDEHFDADKHMATILAHVNKEMGLELEAPKKIEVPQAAKPVTGKGPKPIFFGFGGQAGYSINRKNVKRVRKGTETFALSSRRVVERMTAAAGFVGIGRYPEPMRESLVVDVPAGRWPKAYFLLPPVGVEAGLSRVDFQVELDTEPPQAQVAIWEPGSGWRDARGKARHSLAFGLKGVNGGDLEALRFTQRLTLTRGGSVLRSEAAVDVVNGEVPVATPLETVDTVVVDASTLRWKKLEPESPLVAVQVHLNGGGRSFRGTLKARRVDGDWVEPEPLVWHVPKGTSIRPRIQFVRSDVAAPVKWSGNGKDLEASTSSLELVLRDVDWN